MQMRSPNRFGLFLTAQPGGRPYSDSDLAKIALGLPGIPGLLHTHLYTPASATDPYLDDGAPPPLMLECAFGTIEALEAALAVDGALAKMFGDAPLSQQAMLLRDFPVPNPPPAATCCTYVVTYEGEAEDSNAWLSHYLAHHPAIMARFPGISAIMVASRIDWCSGVAWPRATALQRNRVVFDNPAALDAALASPVRHEMRADFRTLPPFAGRNTHYAMNTRTITAKGVPVTDLTRRATIGLSLLAAASGLAPARAAEDSLTIAYPFDIPTWDPTASTFTGAQSVYKAIFDSPLQYSPDLKLQPRLIAAWAFQDPEKKRLEITLRDGVLFHDGTTLSTEDVKFSLIDRPAKDPTLLIRRILPALDALEVVSPAKAVLVFKNPSPAAPIYLGFLACYFVPKAYIERVGEAEFKQKPIGAGPYKLVQYERGSRVVLEAFDRYWGGAPAIKNVTFQIIPDPTARTAAIESGRADLAVQVPLREMTRLGKIPGLIAEAAPFSEIVMLMTPSYVPALQDERVRLAMQLSIDKAAISKAFYGGLARPLSVLATPGTPGYVENYAFPFDKAKAADLLKQAGFSPDKPVSFPFLATNGAFPNDFDVARAIAGMWKAIGIQADLQEVTLAKYLEYNRSATLPGPALYSWANPTGDPDNYTGKILDSSLPFSAWRDPAVGERVHNLMAEPNDAKRMAGYQALNKEASEHAWAPPLFQAVFTLVHKKALKTVTYEGGYIMPAEYSWVR